MAGINFNDLPQNLQAKLQSFMAPGVTVESAIETAKKFGKWTEADTKQLNALNGGANWGRIMDEFAFDSTKAEQYKKDLPEAQKQNELAQARKRYQRKVEHDEREAFKQGNRNLVAKAAGEVFKGILALTPLGWQACSENKISANMDQSVTIKLTDYSSRLDTMIKNQEKILDAMSESYAGILANLKAIINELKDMGTDISFQLDNILKQLETMLGDIIRNQVTMIADNNQNAEAILAKLQKIINSGDDAQTKLDALMALLGQIKQVGENISATTQEILEEIKNAKAELIKTLNTNNQAVLDAIAKLDANDQRSLDILNDIKALIAKFGSEGNALAQAILVAIGKIDNGKVDLSGIEKLLAAIKDGQVVTNDKLSKLTDLFNKFSANTSAQLNTIISKLDKNSPNYEAQLDAIIKLLEKLDANNDARNQKILDAISKLGVNITNSLTAILNKIGQGGQDGHDYSSVLNAILAKLGDMDNNNANNFNRVIEALGKLSIGDKTDVNLQPILDKLDEILKAIKDHKVTVDVTGKVTCECNCGNNGGVHEGILGDLNDLLG